MESPYADFYLVPMLTRNLAAYRAMARLGRKVYLAHGALEYREYVGEDLRAVFGCVPFPASVKAKRGETVVAAIVGFRSRAHRDRVMKKVYADPAFGHEMAKKMPFDPTRLVYGGFSRLV
jgi:uncharacterized protein YbaA (DUF1428 family)